MIDNTDTVDKKLLKKLKFSSVLDRKVDMALIDLKSESMELFVSAEVERQLGFDDDIVSSLVMNMLNGVSEYGVKSKLDPRKLQITLTPFLQAQPASKFTETLWRRLLKEQERKMKALTTGSSEEEALESQAEDIVEEAKKEELVIPLHRPPLPVTIKQESNDGTTSNASESVSQKVQEALARLSAKVKQEPKDGDKEEAPVVVAGTEKKRKRRWDEEK